MGQVGSSIAKYVVLLALFFAAVVGGSYLLFGHRLFLPGVSATAGLLYFALLAFVLPVAAFAGCGALALRFILRFFTGDVFSLLFAIGFGQFLAASAGLVFQEFAPSLLPLSERGVKGVAPLTIAMQGGVLMGALTGAKQVWTGRKEEDAL